MIKLFNRFKANQSGNVAMMFSVCLIAVVTAVGVAIDYSQLSKAQNLLQNQVDAAVLAASAESMDDWEITREQEIATRKEIALGVLNGNGFDLTGIEPSVIITEQNTVLGRAELEYQLAFGGLLGKKSVKLVAESESGLGVIKSVQMVLVLDNTLSMLQDGKMTALKTGAKDLINAIEESGSGSQVALVPFARYVRIPPEEYTASWVELPAEFDTEITWQQATHTGGTCQLETATRIRDGLEEAYETEVCTGQTTTYEEQSQIIESRFDGCVGTRPSPYSESDESYTLRVPGLLHLIPEQHSGSYESNAWCGRKITPLTDDFDLLEGEVNELYGTDQTYLPSGLLWGQAVLSEGVPFDNAATDNSFDKIMVLMTDGKNSAQIQTGQMAEDNYRAPPYIGSSQNENEYSPEANLATARMCDRIKADGIEIFTIAFQVADTETKNLLDACASNASKAYTAETNDELVERFRHISASLKGNTRLMR